MQKLKRILAKILQVEADDINDESSPDNVENWDSFNALVLVSELEREYQVKFTMQEIRSVTCVKDIRGCLEKHGIQFKKEKQDA